MRFACLIWLDGKELAALPRADGEALDRECLAYDEDLERTEQLVLAQALQAPDQGVTVRVRNGKISTTDGPFAETKEQIGGLVLVEARDLHEAIQVAARSPLARLGFDRGAAGDGAVEPVAEVQGRAARASPGLGGGLEAAPVAARDRRRGVASLARRLAVACNPCMQPAMKEKRCAGGAASGDSPLHVKSFHDPATTAVVASDAARRRGRAAWVRPLHPAPWSCSRRVPPRVIRHRNGGRPVATMSLDQAPSVVPDSVSPR